MQATMICVDDSVWMLKEDYPPTRLQAQADAANLVFATKMASNQANTAGCRPWLGTECACSSRSPATPSATARGQTVLVDRICCRRQRLVLPGLTGERWDLVLLHPQRRWYSRVHYAHVNTTNPVKDERLGDIGTVLKKNNVSLDVVEFEALVAAVGGNSHIVHIPPGEDLCVVLSKSPIITGDEGGGAALLSLLRSPLLSKKDYEVDYKKEAESTSDTPTDNEKAKKGSIRYKKLFQGLKMQNMQEYPTIPHPGRSWN
uniref:Uncharacterized protein n=1 Tax=Oryza rufipogon TaxID=4529 RepID=A0A0E0QWH6_ORYRU